MTRLISSTAGFISCWTTAFLTPVVTRLHFSWSLVAPLFLYCDVAVGCDWHIILVRGMSLVFVGLSTYRATLLVYWVFHWVGTTTSVDSVYSKA
jgi:hypothetical protein